jgi:hypothetical protein
MSSTTLAPRVQSRPSQVRSGRTTARTAPPVRLTRRGRLVVLALGLLLVLAVGVLLAAGSAATRDAGTEQVRVVTVAPGDTLWDIASDVAAATGESDVNDVIATIEDMNALDSSIVYVGQDLRVPTE